MKNFNRLVQIAEPSTKVISAIERDTRPTMKHCPELQERCSKEEFKQLLYAYDGWCKEKMAQTNKYAQVRAVSEGYIQSMSRVCAVLCLVLPRHLAWACLCKLFSDVMPGWYTLSSKFGVGMGFDLLDEVLTAVDRPLREHIVAQVTQGYTLLASSSRLYTFFGQTAPIDDVFPLYDAILCVGPHLMIPLIAAEMVLSRDALLANTALKKVLDNDKLAADADTIVSTALHIFRGLPAELQRRLQAWPLKTPSPPAGSSAPSTPQAAQAAAAAGTAPSTAQKPNTAAVPTAAASVGHSHALRTQLSPASTGAAGRTDASFLATKQRSSTQRGKNRDRA